MLGKFPHLVASVPGMKKTSSTELTSKEEVVLNFGEVPVQSTANRWIELHNFSPVSTDVVSLICFIQWNPDFLNPRIFYLLIIFQTFIFEPISFGLQNQDSTVASYSQQSVVLSWEHHGP